MTQELAPISRRSRKKERTRREIYQAAMALFAERDYDRVTIEDICDNADVAKATFFLHFSNKAALLTVFNENLTQTIAEELTHYNGSAADKLRLIIKALATAWQNNATVMRKMVREFVDAVPTLEEGSQANAHISELLGDVIAQGQESGEFQNTIPAHRMAAAMVASSSAVTMEWSQEPGIDTRQAHIDMLELTLGGLLK
ncbi:MAG: TetR/AcrR family transcriptional regulator [Parvibaculaceae bacterium]|nr:TetR/AcrR family transcriptional regulator [Parvibaculaceae bacterium]